MRTHTFTAQRGATSAAGRPARTRTGTVSRNRTAARTLTLAAAAVLAGLLAGCGGGHDGSSAGMPGMPGMSGTPTAAASPGSASPMPGMPGMTGMPDGDGLADSAGGYRMVPRTDRLAAGTPAAYRFTISGPGGTPVTAFGVEQTERLHFYAIRSDLTGFRHLHPTMAADGTWTADLAALDPGGWRFFASFTPDAGPGRGKDFVLSRTVTVPGNATIVPLPKAASTTTVDGYTVTLKGELMAGMAHEVTVHIAKDGRPVTDLEPYLDAYAHLTAFRAGDQAFAHLHPTAAAAGPHGGPDLTFHAELPKPGAWRLFLQFRAAGTLHTAALTVQAG